MADIFLHDPGRAAGAVTLDDPAVQGGGGPGPQNVNIALIDQSYQIFAPTIDVDIPIALINQQYTIYQLWASHPSSEIPTDQFTTSIDSKWDQGNAPSIDAGRLKLGLDNTYDAIVLKDYYDLTDASVTLRIDSITGTLTEGVDTGLFLVFDAFNRTGSTYSRNNGAAMVLGNYGGGISLIAWKLAAGSGSQQASIAYNSTNHKYIRLRETSSTFYWEYSTDGHAWTTLHSEATWYSVQHITVDIFGGEWDTGTPSGNVFFDDLQNTYVNLALIDQSYQIFGPATMQLEFTDRGFAAQSADQSSYTFGTLTPAANTWLIVDVVSYISGGTPAAPTLSDNGPGLTYAQQATVLGGGGTAANNRITRFQAFTGASPGTFSITADFNSITQNACAMHVTEIAGGDAADITVQTVTNNSSGGSGTTGTVTLAAYGAPVNRPLVVWMTGGAAATVTPETPGYTELRETSGDSQQDVETAYGNFADTSVTATFAGTTHWAGIASELKVAEAGQSVNVGFIDQTYQIFAVTTDADVNLALIDQTNQIFGTTVSHDVGISLIDQTYTMFDETIDATVNIGFIDQSYQIFAITTNVDLPIALIDQTYQIFAVDTTASVQPDLIDNTYQIFAVTVDADVNLALIDQSYVIFAVTIEQGQMITPDLIDQTYTMFNVSITPGDHPNVNIALIDQTYVMFGSTISIPQTYTVYDFINWYRRLDACEDPNHDHYPHEGGYIEGTELHLPVIPDDWTPDDDELVDALE